MNLSLMIVLCISRVHSNVSVIDIAWSLKVTCGVYKAFRVLRSCMTVGKIQPKCALSTCQLFESFACKSSPSKFPEPGNLRKAFSSTKSWLKRIHRSKPPPTWNWKYLISYQEVETMSCGLTKSVYTRSAFGKYKPRLGFKILKTSNFLHIF